MESDPEEIIAIYRQRWEIELLFKQIKQNFPLKYFYGESANAIKIQIWVTLIANLLLMVMQNQTSVEFLRAGDNGQNTPNVLPRLPQSLQQSRKGLGKHPFHGFRCTTRTISF